MDKVRFTVSDGKMLDEGCVPFEDDNGNLEASFIRTIKHSIGSNMDTMIYVLIFSSLNYPVRSYESV